MDNPAGAAYRVVLVVRSNKTQHPIIYKDAAYIAIARVLLAQSKQLSPAS
jgi:hypothetical protein